MVKHVTVTRPLDVFGKFVIANLRDKAFRHADACLDGKMQTPLKSRLSTLTAAERELLRAFARAMIDTALHDFLFALSESHESEQPLQVLVAGVDVAAESDGLQGELFGATGWRARFSDYGRGA
jgi:hypothetical protein